MRTLEFYKYHGAGNDFIILDDRDLSFPLDNYELVSKLCDRRFGIGADGLMLLQNSKEYDFKMVYYNSDGKQGTMCGNGGRCITAFAYKLNLINNSAEFEAIDGVHKAKITDIEPNICIVELDMIDVEDIKAFEGFGLLNTGSPHYVQFVEDVEALNINEIGPAIRFNKDYGQSGVNVNFIELINHHTLFVRTYERGVEAETFSCGTGVTASALWASYKSIIGGNRIDIETKGGQLSVSFENIDSKFVNVKLTGPAEFVFKGEIKF